ncbi:hypothetical protein [Companilactobacillus furfuricola]|uniref:hypothetical protein n=1 Tax=Companilactobacillus furfuricola TaxID=1462575 RepID=UPI000F7B44FE|nr:hypothetical protein [Companilactobacillus furfuricola]
MNILPTTSTCFIKKGLIKEKANSIKANNKMFKDNNINGFNQNCKEKAPRSKRMRVKLPPKKRSQQNEQGGSIATARKKKKPHNDQSLQQSPSGRKISGAKSREPRKE